MAVGILPGCFVIVLIVLQVTQVAFLYLGPSLGGHSVVHVPEWSRRPYLGPLSSGGHAGGWHDHELVAGPHPRSGLEWQRVQGKTDLVEKPEREASGKFLLPPECLPRWHSGQESTWWCRRCKILWRRKWHPLQHSCLWDSMDRGAWWAAAHGVAHSWTQLSMRANAFLTLESPPICDVFTSDLDIFGCFSNWQEIDPVN